MDKKKSDFWLPNPRFPAGYREKVKELAAERGLSAASLIVRLVLERIDADIEWPVSWGPRSCGHPPSAPTRIRRSGARVCWCGASITKPEVAL